MSCASHAVIEQGSVPPHVTVKVRNVGYNKLQSYPTPILLLSGKWQIKIFYNILHLLPRAVEFNPGLSVIAGYPAFGLHQDPAWKAVTFIDDPDLAWIGLDSSKRMMAEQSPVFVVQSSAKFAQRHLEERD